jgi:hypothetical protein
MINRMDFTKLVGKRLRITKGDIVRQGLMIGRAEDHFPDRPEWVRSWILYDDTAPSAGADISIREQGGWRVEVIDDPLDDL